MFNTLAKLVPQDKDYPTRAHTLEVYTRFLNDTIYDALGTEFWQEYTDANEYVPINRRIPSVRYALLSTVVKDSVSFLFAEGRFPAFDTGDDETSEQFIDAVVKDAKLNSVLIDAAMRGSIGSVAIWLRVLQDRVFCKALNTTYLTPKFKADAPDVLEEVKEEYKVKGRVLRESGYDIPDENLGADYWFKRVWDEKSEVWFKPIKVDGDNRPTVPDTKPGRTTKHGLGFVPMVWIKNLPGGDDIDGECTFRLAIPNSIEINYQLSQAGRGLKYSSSPTLMIKDDNAGLPTEKQKRIASDAIIVPSNGDAKLLEISGEAATAVIEYTRELRKMALEAVGGSRSDSDKLSAATSGRAMELMNQALINLADTLRASYGEDGLLRLIKMIGQVSRSFKLKNRDGDLIGSLAEKTKVSLVWPRWFAPTADDRQADAGALSTLKAAGLMSTETAVRALAADYDVEDVEAEVKAVAAEAEQAQEAQLALKAASVKIPPAQR